jgi:Fe-S cluster assembly iron-binding protein IscA
MLTVSKKAAAVLKAAKAAQGAPPEVGVRIVKGNVPDDSGKSALAVGFTISDDPAPNDEEIEQSGLRIFIEDALVEPLDGRTLDVSEGEGGPELIFR